MVTVREAATRTDRLLSTSEVADLLNISERTVNKLVAEGELTKLKIRGSIRFLPDSVRALLLRAQRDIVEGDGHGKAS